MSDSLAITKEGNDVDIRDSLKHNPVISGPYTENIGRLKLLIVNIKNTDTALTIVAT